MRKYGYLICFVLISMSSATAKSVRTSWGLLAMAGGRYDDVRMCVGSDAGVKGGPIGDIMFSLKFEVSPDQNVKLNIPVMRPILFGAAFEMLQFEPEVIWEFFITGNAGNRFFAAPGLGLSFHHGPDNRSTPDDRGKSFFAMGPMINFQMGLYFDPKYRKCLSLKIFYVPIFSENGFPDGTVMGGAVQYSLYY